MNSEPVQDKDKQEQALEPVKEHRHTSLADADSLFDFKQQPLMDSEDESSSSQSSEDFSRKSSKGGLQ